jgi:glucosamine 6-phosphate synthetase-like amidotransferase/phosphosugar isomerase protein
MLLEMESRGRHATGLAWNDSAEGVYITKANISATRFVRKNVVPQGISTFIGHTRLATKGSPMNNDNNHPIDAFGIVGIHNGRISNDDDLFEVIGSEHRIAQVDSEAIFALLSRGESSALEALAMVEGSAALAWMQTNQAEILHLARVRYSPLVIGHTKKGSILFASTPQCLNNVSRQQGIDLEEIEVLREGDYLQVQHGEILTREHFIPKKTIYQLDPRWRAPVFVP